MQRSILKKIIGSTNADGTTVRQRYDVEAIESIFTQARARDPSVNLLMLSTADGRAIAQHSALDIDGRRLAAMANSFLTLGETVSRELSLNQADYATVCTASGNVVLIRISADTPLTLTAVGDSQANLAALLFRARECAAQLHSALSHAGI